jgi:GT2 family glycosyltransferase
MTIAFVILHYKTLEETRECLDSLLKLTQPESIRMQIIVVDNASNNGSLESLHQQYGTTSDVHFIALPENCGFARGNNAGYAYAKDTLQADFIILLNNDTEIRQPDFMPKLLLIYESTAFDVLGPDIYTLDQQHQNPKAKRGYSKAEVDAKIRQTRCNLWLIKTGLYELLITWNRIKRKRQPVKTGQKQRNETAINQQHNVVLHGSCLVFASDYIRRFNGLFSGTFLYCEEEILWTFAQQENLRLVYDPSLQVLHKEDRATQSLHQTNRQKRIFKLKYELDSLQQLAKLMDQPECFRNQMIDYKHEEGG